MPPGCFHTGNQKCCAQAFSAPPRRATLLSLRCYLRETHLQGVSMSGLHSVHLPWRWAIFGKGADQDPAGRGPGSEWTRVREALQHHGHGQPEPPASRRRAVLWAPRVTNPGPPILTPARTFRLALRKPLKA
jgi:hypothetical protein